jgi:hypothetical protein
MQSLSVDTWHQEVLWTAWWLLVTVLAYQARQMCHSHKSRLRHSDPARLQCLFRLLCVHATVPGAPQILRPTRNRNAKFNANLDGLFTVVLRRKNNRESSARIARVYADLLEQYCWLGWLLHRHQIQAQNVLNDRLRIFHEHFDQNGS